MGELQELAAVILASDAWFSRLPSSSKDALSQPNHDAQQAERAVELARLVQHHFDGTNDAD